MYSIKRVGWGKSRDERGMMGSSSGRSDLM
jgi:hypothetical protein